MSKPFVMIIVVAFLLLSLNAEAQPDQMSAGSPPISQALVPQGDFALKLAAALKLGAPDDEAQAEDMLTSAGIAPKNGWIADYPLTPNIIGELQNSVATAADSKRLPMGKDEALEAFHGLTMEFGLAVSPGSAGEYAENQPQPDASAINNYYYEEGPPVVSYYPPPWDYYYLYSWVPYPFWWGGFFFSGFFCLHDFHRFVVVGHHNHLISNHFIDPATHAVRTIDPASHTLTHVSRTAAGFGSATTRNSAASIFNRSVSSTGARTFSNSSRFATGSEMNHGSFQSFSKSFGSFSSRGSSGCVNCHGSGSSFRRGSGHSFSSFSGGHSFGGFSGGHGGGGGGRR
jgi:hypothetical protein